MTEEMLEIVDEADNVIGLAPRSRVHKEGLLHREVHVVFITPDGDLIFQKRSMKKDTNPGVMAMAVGGHVNPGEDYMQAALREAKEETGLVLSADNLVMLSKIRATSVKQAHGTNNQSWRTIYGHIFRGDLAELKIEAEESDGYETYPLSLMMTFPELEKHRFTGSIFNPEIYGPIYKKLAELIKK